MDSRALLIPLLFILSACATTPTAPPPRTYTADAQPDGSLRVVVTATSQPLASAGGVSLPLAHYLRNAANELCPDGYDLEQDKMPEAARSSGRIVASLGGIVRCHAL